MGLCSLHRPDTTLLFKEHWGCECERRITKCVLLKLWGESQVFLTMCQTYITGACEVSFTLYTSTNTLPSLSRFISLLSFHHCLSSLSLPLSFSTLFPLSLFLSLISFHHCLSSLYPPLFLFLPLAVTFFSPHRSVSPLSLSSFLRLSHAQ